jgi:hypothetical protein
MWRGDWAEIEKMDITNKPTGACGKCGTRPATTWYTVSIYEAVHGRAEARCERCCIEEQLADARKMAARIPALEAQLASLP